MGILAPAPLPTLNLSAKAYGARFDGTTDDTAALQAAIDAAYAKGGAFVDCPEGTAVVTGLDVKNHVYLRGRGMRATRLLRKSGLGASATPVVKPHVSSDAGATDPNAEYWGVLDLWIDGNKSAYSGQAVGAYHGLQIDASPAATKGAADDTTDVRGLVQNVLVTTCRGSGVSSSATARSANRFVNVIVEGCDQYGVVVGPDAHYVGVSAHSNGLHGFYANGVAGSQLSSCKATLNGQSYVGVGAVTAPNGFGFYFGACSAIEAMGLVAQDNQGAGVGIDAASNGVRVDAVADSNSRVTAGAHPGFDVWNSDYCDIRGTASDRNASGTTWQTNALQVRTTSDYNRIVLTSQALNGATLGTPLRSAVGGTANEIRINGSDCSQGETVTWAATITPDPFKGSVKFVTLAGATTVAAPSQTNHPVGSVLTFVLTQDATGGRTVSWNAAYKVVGFQPSATANAVSVVTFLFDGTNWTQIQGTHPGHLGGRAVATTAPTNGQVLTWNSGPAQWEPQAAGGGGTMAGFKVVSAYGATGDGTTDDAASINAAITAASSGEIVWMPPGLYRTSVPINLKTGVTLRGTHAARWVYNMPSTTGPCTIKALAGFTGTGLIKADGTAADVTEVRIQNVGLHGNEQATHGVHLIGGCLGFQIENVNITALSETGANVGGADASGIRTNTATRSAATVFAKGLVLRQVWAYSNCRGFSLNNTTDIEIEDCGAQDNAKDGWLLSACAMVTGRGVNALFNRNRGIEITGSATDMIDLDVVTDRNEFDGVRVNTTAATSRVRIKGMTRRDGRNANAGGGNYAGVALKSCGPTWVDVNQQVGVDDGAVTAGGESPAYGVSCDTVTWASLGGVLAGVTNPIRDVGSNVDVVVRPGVLAQNGSKFSSTVVTVSPLNGISSLAFSDGTKTAGVPIVAGTPNDGLVPVPFDGLLVYDSTNRLLYVRRSGAYETVFQLQDALHSQLGGLTGSDHPQYEAWWNDGFCTEDPARQSGGTQLAVNANAWVSRVRVRKTGSIRSIAAYVTTAGAGGALIHYAIYDLGDTAAGTYTRKALGSVAATATGWKEWDPNFAVTAGQQIAIYVWGTDATMLIARAQANDAGLNALPSGYNAVPGGASPSVVGKVTGVSPPATLADATVFGTPDRNRPIIIGRIA